MKLCKKCNKVIENTDLDLAHNCIPKPDMMSSGVSVDSLKNEMCRKCHDTQ